MGGALQDQKSGRGAEGIGPAHSTLENLLSSQAGPLPSKVPSRPHGSLGHRRETRRRTGDMGGRGPLGPEEQ